MARQLSFTESLKRAKKRVDERNVRRAAGQGRIYGTMPDGFKFDIDATSLQKIGGKLPPATQAIMDQAAKGFDKGVQAQPQTQQVPKHLQDMRAFDPPATNEQEQYILQAYDRRQQLAKGVKASKDQPGVTAEATPEQRQARAAQATRDQASLASPTESMKAARERMAASVQRRQDFFDERYRRQRGILTPEQAEQKAREQEVESLAAIVDKMARQYGPKSEATKLARATLASRIQINARIAAAKKREVATDRRHHESMGNARTLHALGQGAKLDAATKKRIAAEKKAQTTAATKTRTELIATTKAELDEAKGERNYVEGRIVVLQAQMADYEIEMLKPEYKGDDGKKVRDALQARINKTNADIEELKHGRLKRAKAGMKRLARRRQRLNSGHKFVDIRSDEIMDELRTIKALDDLVISGKRWKADVDKETWDRVEAKLRKEKIVEKLQRKGKK